LIGNEALAMDGHRFILLDLGEEWNHMTRLPFVYAAWAVRRGTCTKQLYDALHEMKRRGLNNSHAIAEQAAEQLGLPLYMCQCYISRIISYDLGHEEIDGLSTFQQHASELGLCKRDIPLYFYHP